jgi:small subunit ribosomal protein S21
MTMMVKVHENDLERALQTFKRRLQKSGLFKELRKRSFYEKPSEKRRRKRQEARRKRNV